MTIHKHIPGLWLQISSWFLVGALRFKSGWRAVPCLYSEKGCATSLPGRHSRRMETADDCAQPRRSAPTGGVSGQHRLGCGRMRAGQPLHRLARPLGQPQGHQSPDWPEKGECLARMDKFHKYRAAIEDFQVWIIRPRVFQSRTEWPIIRTSLLDWINFVHPIFSIISSKSYFFEMDLS